ncbi:MAG: hypothetical protein KF852_16770 [Saprospiraceae bacterium]|nr:hypothetical protein [Saprospiraceae bacterium]
MNRAAFPFCLLLLSILLPTGCEDHATREAQAAALLKTRLEERIDMGRLQRIEDCNKRLLDSAMYLVDSIRVLEAQWALDTMIRPFKPVKPGPPGPGISLDSLKLKPLLPDSIRRQE